MPQINVALLKAGYAGPMPDPAEIKPATDQVAPFAKAACRGRNRYCFFLASGLRLAKRFRPLSQTPGVFSFMSALIGGLAGFILSRTAGDIGHVTIEAEEANPALLLSPKGTVLLVQRADTETAQLGETTSFVPLLEALPAVQAVSAQISGAGFVRRGGQVAQVSIPG